MPGASPSQVATLSTAEVMGVSTSHWMAWLVHRMFEHSDDTLDTPSVQCNADSQH